MEVSGAHRQGPGRGLGHAARARDPGRGRELRLRHPEAGPGALRRRARMDRRDALPTPPPAPPARVRDDRMADAARGPSSQVLRHHRRREGRAGGTATAVDDRHARPRRPLEGARWVPAGAGRSMTTADVESQIAEWRAYVAQAPAVDGHDVDELEGHLRDQMTELAAAGLSGDEAFLVAMKRMGDL